MSTLVLNAATRDDLVVAGYSVQRSVGSLDAFRVLCRELGPILREDAIRVRPDAKTYVARSEAIPFHTDHPDAHWIAWYCVSQDVGAGANLLLDGWALVRALSRETQAGLVATHLQCDSRDGGPPVNLLPIWIPPSVCAQPRLFYAPWLSATEGEWKRRAALVALQNAISVQSISPISVLLSPGDVLLIDNHRMLHGRGSIRKDSKRELLRIWIA